MGIESDEPGGSSKVTITYENIKNPQKDYKCSEL